MVATACFLSAALALSANFGNVKVQGPVGDRLEKMVRNHVAAKDLSYLTACFRCRSEEGQRRYRLKFADTYYGELNHYGMYWLKWADVRR